MIAQHTTQGLTFTVYGNGTVDSFGLRVTNESGDLVADKMIWYSTESVGYHWTDEDGLYDLPEGVEWTDEDWAEWFDSEWDTELDALGVEI